MLFEKMKYWDGSDWFGVCLGVAGAVIVLSIAIIVFSFALKTVITFF